jgi:MFS family permease
VDAQERRGLASGLITATNPLTNATIAVLTFGLLMMLLAGSVASPYVQWGWRIPIVIGGLLAFAVFAYYVRNVEEGPDFEASAAAESPVKALFFGQHRGSLVQVFTLMTGMWFLANVAAAVLPATLKNSVGVPDKTVSVIMLIASVVTVGGFLGAAVLPDDRAAALLHRLWHHFASRRRDGLRAAAEHTGEEPRGHQHPGDRH